MGSVLRGILQDEKKKKLIELVSQNTIYRAYWVDVKAMHVDVCSISSKDHTSFFTYPCVCVKLVINPSQTLLIQ